MSAYVCGLIWKLAISRTAKVILLRLADHGNDEGKSIFPGMESLADATDADERTVQRIMRDLEELGVLKDVGDVKYGRGITRGWHLDLTVLKRSFPTVKGMRKATPKGKKINPPSPKELLEGWRMPSKEGGEGDPENPGTTPPFEGDENPGATPPFEGKKNPGTDAEKGGVGNTKGGRDAPPEPPGTVTEKAPASGGDPDGPPGAGTSGEAGQGSEPINTAWKNARPIFAKWFGEPMARAWWDICIPLRYEGDCLILGLPATTFYLQTVPRQWGGKMASAYRAGGAKGKIAFEKSEIATKAQRARKAKMGVSGSD